VVTWSPTDPVIARQHRLALRVGAVTPMAGAEHTERLYEDNIADSEVWHSLQSADGLPAASEGIARVRGLSAPTPPEIAIARVAQGGNLAIRQIKA